jgi:predicted ATPase
LQAKVTPERLAMNICDFSIKGYRSVRSLRMPVRRLTVLTGANGVGKTNLYRALELVQAAADGDLALSLAREGGLASALWAGPRKANEQPRLEIDIGLEGALGETAENDATLRYRVEIGFGDSKYGAVFAEEPQIKRETLTMPLGRRTVTLLERSGAAAWYRDENGQRRQVEDTILGSETALSSLRGTLPEVDLVRRLLSSWRFYHSFRTDRDGPPRRPALAVTAPLLDADGGNLAAVFATLAHIRGDTTDLTEAIDSAVPGARLIIPPPGQDARFSMVFPEFPHRPFEQHELSDGTLQFLALLGALLSYRLPPLIALNEPEASLHPDLLPALARAIAKAATRTQVWVVTHSPILSEAIASETGTVPRTVIRRDGGSWIEGLNDIGLFGDDD